MSRKEKTEKDVVHDQDGKMINPHNPDFITKVPWYLGSSGPTLTHHNVQKESHELSMAETDKLVTEKINRQKELAKLNQQKGQVYKKGACKNCGSTTHKEKDCVERPRSSKKAAWKSGLDICPDDVNLNFSEHGKMTFSAKRDQWQGYNPEEYQGVIDRYERLDAERKKHRDEEKALKKLQNEEKLKKKEIDKLKRKEDKKNNISNNIKGDNNIGDNIDDKSDSDKGSASDSDSDSDYDSDEDSGESAEENKDFIANDEDAKMFQSRIARQGGVGGAQMKTTVRNLRIREDTPKYLRNLSLDSAHYDPKAHSMRSNPLPGENPEDLAYAGDNFMRYSGDALKLAQTQVLCLDMEARGGDKIDVLSNPSQAELMQKQFVEKKFLLEEKKRNEIFDKYGGESYLNQKLDPRLKLGQTESFIQYSRDGRVLKGSGVKEIARTKYEEDVYNNNHTSVWGSYYSKHNRKWGYSCCHSLARSSYCVGEIGKTFTQDGNISKANDNNNKKIEGSIKQDDKTLSSSIKTSIGKKSDIYGDSSISNDALDKDKLKASLLKEENFHNSNNDNIEDRKRNYNSTKGDDTSQEDMEAYRLKKVQRDDPMLAILQSDTILEYK